MNSVRASHSDYQRWDGYTDRGYSESDISHKAENPQFRQPERNERQQHTPNRSEIEIEHNNNNQQNKWDIFEHVRVHILVHPHIYDRDARGCYIEIVTVTVGDFRHLADGRVLIIEINKLNNNAKIRYFPGLSVSAV